jgi:hypothetical protein
MDGTAFEQEFTHGAAAAVFLLVLQIDGGTTTGRI